MKIHEFPTVSISKQLFHVPGAAVEGGYTAGSVRIVSPEPGGRGILEVQMALRDEWGNPWASWIMSKTNGQVFRIKLTKTPQIITARSLLAPAFTAWPRDEEQWQAPDLSTDINTVFTLGALEGSNVVVIDVGPIGPILKHGHLIGHGDQTYLVDDIEYVSETRARVTVTPPLRKNIVAGQTCMFRPYFLGTISNGGEIITTYDAEQRGHIQVNKIVFSEVIL